MTTTYCIVRRSKCACVWNSVALMSDQLPDPVSWCGPALCLLHSVTHSTMRTTFERFCKEMQENPLDDLGTWRCGYVLNSAAAEKLKKQFEKSSSSRFVVLKSDGHFGKMRECHCRLN